MPNNSEISLEEAINIQSDGKGGDVICRPLELGDFGRIVVQTARQVLIQKIRDFEKENLFKKIFRKGRICDYS
mgnify:CR=1 FL=1